MPVFSNGLHGSKYQRSTWKRPFPVIKKVRPKANKTENTMHNMNMYSNYNTVVGMYISP